MTREHRGKRFTYFRVDSTGGSTFQHALKSYIQEKTTVKLRKQDITAGTGTPSRTQFINHYHDSDVFFAEFLSFEAGKAVHALDPSLLEADHVDLENVWRMLNQEQRREVVDGMCYLAAVDGHVVLAQSMALGVRDLEGYINAMVPGVPGIPASCRYQFVRGLQLQAVDDLSNAKSISIGSPVAQMVPTAPNDNDAGRRKKKKMMMVRNDRALEVIRAATGSGLESFDADEAVDLTTLEVRVDIKYRRYNANRKENMIEHLTRSLRDVPEDNITIELHNQGKLQGNTLFLWAVKSVEHIDGAPVAESVEDKMKEWLTELSKQGMI